MCLLVLPTELHESITDLLDRRSLLCLRQVHSKLKANTSDVFGKSFFANRTHVATKHSLETLRLISATSHLVKHINRVEIVTVGLDAEYAKSVSAPGLFSCGPGPWREEVDDTFGITSCGLLDKIFHNLRKAGKGRELVVSRFQIDSHPETPGYEATTHDVQHIYGLRTYIRSLYPWSLAFNLSGKGTRRVSEALLKAVARSGHQVVSLCMDDHDLEGIFCIGELTHADWEGLQLLGKGLQKAAFTLDSEPILRPTISASLSAAVNLRELSVRDVDARVLHQLSECLGIASRLETLRMIYVEDRSNLLVSFLTGFKKTLRFLYIEVFLGNDCRGFCEALLNRLEIRELELKNLREYDPINNYKDHMFMDSTSEDCWKAEDELAVRTLLQQLVEEGNLLYV